MPRAEDDEAGDDGGDDRPADYLFPTWW